MSDWSGLVGQDGSYVIVNLVNSVPLFQLSLSDVCADESYFEPCQDLG